MTYRRSTMHTSGDQLVQIEPSIYQTDAHKDSVYGQLIDRAGCGPFDGGCLVFAQALQILHGGDVHVIVGSQQGYPEAAQHAILKHPAGYYGDSDGFVCAEEMLRRFQENEGGGGSLRVSHIREMRPGDLHEAVRDDSLVNDIARALKLGF